MISRRAPDIKSDLLDALKKCSDASFEKHGFKRSLKSTIYGRNVKDAMHQVCINVNYNPKSRPGMELELLPTMRLKMDAVLAQAVRLSEGCDNILPPEPEFIVSQPIHFTAPKDKFIQWFAAGREQINHSVSDVFAFCELWVIPFLDKLSTPQDLINIYTECDGRMMKQNHWYIFIAAAYIVNGHPSEALKVLDRKLGSAGMRKQYAVVFESVRKLSLS